MTSWKVWQFDTLLIVITDNSYNRQKGVTVPDQETYGRFTPSAWNLIKSVRLSEEEQEKLNAMIEAKTETITFNEAKAMLYAVVRES